MEVNIKTEGASLVKAHLDAKAERLGNFEFVWPKVKDAVIQYQKDYLASRGFGTFAGLKPSTLKRKNRRSNNPFDTTSHQMWDSFIGVGPDFYYEADGNRMEIGVRAGPAHWHMLPRKHMPARPPIRMTPRLRREIRDVINRFIKGT
jgi:hypothetical protein